MKKIVIKMMVGLLVLLMSGMLLTACTSSGPVVKEQTTDVKVSENEDKVAESEVKKEETKPEETVELTISAAASLKESMGELQELYKTEKQNVKLTFNFGSSGSLQQQIEQGAPVDIFLSAALKQMKALEEKDLIVSDTKKELLENEVVLITPKDKTDLISFEDLGTDKVKKIGLGDPKSVPVGQYADEIIKKLEIEDKVTSKAVYGKDVKAVLAWVEMGEVDAGVVYATDAKVSGKINVVCSAPEGSHKPAIYPVAAIKTTKHLEEAKAFIAFLSTDVATKVFEKYGFKTK